MDKMQFEKIWQNDNVIELKISACSEYASAYQNCYIQDTDLKEIGEKICDYVSDHTNSCYLEFCQKEGNYTPAFSMEVLPADVRGHEKIEVDIEINDNDTRAHRCCFYINSELGLVEQLGKSLKWLVTERIGESV